MSVTQLLSLRCNGIGACLPSAAANISSVCTTIRHLFPAICMVPFSTCEQKLLKNQGLKLGIQRTEKAMIKHYFPNQINAGYQPNSLSHQRLIPFSIRVEDHENRKIKIEDDWLAIGHGLFYSISESQIKSITHRSASKYKKNNFCSSQVKEAQKDLTSNDLPSEETLQRVAAILTKDLTGIFVHRPEYRIYRHDIVLENRIHNKVVYARFCSK